MTWLLGAMMLVSVAGGPEIGIERPVPDRIGTEDTLEFGVQVRSDTETPELSFQVFSSTAPSDKTRGGDGVSLEVSTDPGSWRPVELGGSYGWFGSVDIGPLGRGETRNFGVRIRSTKETGRIPVEVRLATRISEPIVSDGFHVEIVPGAVLPRTSFGWGRFGLGAAIGVVGMVAVLMMFRLVRRRRP